MLCGFQSNLRYNSSTTILCYWGVWIILCACTIMLDWNCFHSNVCSFQSLPFSRSVPEIRLEGEWVPYSAYSLQTVSRFFNLPQHFIWTRTVRRGAYRFFYSKKTRKSNLLQMTSGNTSRQLFKDPDGELVGPGFETAASHSVDLCLSTWS